MNLWLLHPTDGLFLPRPGLLIHSAVLLPSRNRGKKFTDITVACLLLRRVRVASHPSRLAAQLQLPIMGGALWSKYGGTACLIKGNVAELPGHEVWAVHPVDAAVHIRPGKPATQARITFEVQVVEVSQRAPPRRDLPYQVVVGGLQAVQHAQQPELHRQPAPEVVVAEQQVAERGHAEPVLGQGARQAVVANVQVFKVHEAGPLVGQRAAEAVPLQRDLLQLRHVLQRQWQRRLQPVVLQLHAAHLGEVGPCGRDAAGEAVVCQADVLQ
mmetsp:Transcript_20641/g.51995  ORF Transcript_20641/g.51995 Transcript_20641/m.51995 type:complete len:270 (+) Transcript_20641:118-927(+)